MVRTQTLTQKIVPYYLKSSGEWSVDEYIVELFFSQIIKDGNLYTVFMDGRINSFSDFMDLVQSDMAKLFMAFAEDGSPLGIMMLNWFEGKTARVHFCMFKSHGVKDKIQAAKDFIDLVFGMEFEDGSRLFEALIGSTPVSNKPASSLAVHLGFKDIGIQPCAAINKSKGAVEDVILRYIKPEMRGWLNGK